MLPPKPDKTTGDYLAIAVGPVLIMLLVGSLAFFLVEIFFRDTGGGGVRWVMFWFVMAVVLVSRIGIEQGPEYAAGYGVMLALATWFYLMRIHPQFILGMILLGITWWCAHKLTYDCTLIDEDEDASGEGLLQTAGDWKKLKGAGQKAKEAKKEKNVTPHPPGVWLVYFSLGALPLFGLGQVLLPGDAVAERRAGLIFLFIYLAAALGLLLTTSFLGLRRYLRQRRLPMPTTIALGWVRFGAVVAGFVLLGALLLPRPGAGDAWLTLRDQVDHRLQQASQYAMRFNPAGKGEGRQGTESDNTKSDKNPTGKGDNQQSQEPSKSPGDQGPAQNQRAPSQVPSPGGGASLYSLLRILFWVGLVLIAAWWGYRQRHLIAQIIRSMAEGLRQFLARVKSDGEAPRPAAKITEPARKPFRSYENPFLTGEASKWTTRELVLYSFEVLQAWAGEHGVKAQEEQTAREFCHRVGEQFPEITLELSRFAFLYSRAAYGANMPTDHDLEPVKSLWRYFLQSSHGEHLP